MIRLVCIGTSDAFGSGGRRQSAYLLQAPDGGVLLDCGATTTTGLEELAIPRDAVDVIALSHFHGDHFGGIPLFLLAAEYVDGRTRALRIAGPPGVEERVRGAATALGHPVRDRDLGFELSFHELPPGVAWTTGSFTIEAFATFHSPDSSPHGLISSVAGRRIAFSGDTGWFDGLPGCVEGADLFLCECTQDRADYEYHLSLEELSKNRDAFECGRILLTHLGPEMRTRDEHEGFEVADDGLIVEL